LRSRASSAGDRLSEASELPLSSRAGHFSYSGPCLLRRSEPCALPNGPMDINWYKGARWCGRRPYVTNTDGSNDVGPCAMACENLVELSIFAPASLLGVLRRRSVPRSPCRPASHRKSQSSDRRLGVPRLVSLARTIIPAPWPSSGRAFCAGGNAWTGSSVQTPLVTMRWIWPRPPSPAFITCAIGFSLHTPAVVPTGSPVRMRALPPACCLR
jgi:hypothetical protein